jgi:Rod binding domain-containing protein
LSISPPSDIVFDVAKAADPQKYRQAVEKLAGVGGASAEIAELGVSQQAFPPAPGAVSSPAPRKTEPPANAYQQFEAYFLQTFVESMLPKDSNALFGSGPAGNIWRSMLAEHLAGNLAKSAEFGIAKKLAENRAVQDKAKAERMAQHSATAPATADQGGGYAGSLFRLLATDGERAESSAQNQSTVQGGNDHAGNISN